MPPELLDSDNQIYISPEKRLAAIFLFLIGMGHIYMGIDGWYEHYHPRGLLVIIHFDEMFHPICILLGILTTGIGIATWLDKITLFKAILLGVTIIIGGHTLILNFLAG